MAIRDYGFYGFAFVTARPLQIIALGVLVGMTGNLISQNSHAHFATPGPVLGTIVVSSITLLWTVLSITAYDDAHIPYWATAALDLLLAVPFVVGAAVLGGPLGGFNCSVLPTAHATDLLAIQTKAATATSPAAYILFVGNSQTTCYQIMAIWGLALALCALFSVTGLAASLLYLGRRRSLPRAAPEITATTSCSVVRGPSPMMPVYRSEPGSIQLASAASKWCGPDEYDDDRHGRNSVHGSLHGRRGSGRPDNSLDDGSFGARPSPASPANRGRSTVMHEQRPLPIGTRGITASAEARAAQDPDNDDDDSDSNDSVLSGGLTTPLSPPPQTHQTMFGLGGPNSTPNSRRASAASSRYSTTSRASSLFQPPPSPPTASSSLLPALSPPSDPGGPPLHLAVMPILGTNPESTTPRLPLLQLTANHTLPKYAATVPALSAPLPTGRAILWPLAYPPSPVWRQHDLPSPLSPILPPRSPLSFRQQQEEQRQCQRQQLLTHRKTLLQRIEGWWDLGLLRGGTIKGRGRPLAAINAVSAMASPRSEPCSAGSSAEPGPAGQLPAAFV
ncbi:hypothetical protein SEPCBS119000_003856 [Sporothrix epigloea]|uniref:MARVEL domain-containing protein n=1 Tax=Sporothrix epigloea TaxID=1892477 RepID=A0ABP0DNY5_9PEZI